VLLRNIFFSLTREELTVKSALLPS
jgi:hypothetical protein